MRDMKASELMTPDPVTVGRDTSIADAARRLREHDIGSVPVVSDDPDRHLLGVITDRDIACRCSAEGHDPRECTAGSHMSENVRTARAGDGLDTIKEIMSGSQVRRVPVTDDDGRILGIVAQADLAVEAVENDAIARIDVAETLEQISEPAHPQRKG